MNSLNAIFESQAKIQEDDSSSLTWNTNSLIVLASLGIATIAYLGSLWWDNQKTPLPPNPTIKSPQLPNLTLPSNEDLRPISPDPISPDTSISTLNQTINAPIQPNTYHTLPHWANKRILSVGAWAPGIKDKLITIAFDHTSSRADSIQFLLSPNTYRPDFAKDFMDVPSESLPRCTMIVFHGICNLTVQMGGGDCFKPPYEKENYFPSISLNLLAQKIKNLVSNKYGAFVFFRHCLEFASPNGIEDPNKRRDFIQLFEKEGFVLQTSQFLYPDNPNLPDPDKKQLIDKWKPCNGGIAFYWPPQKP